jgi:hypothetical protein
MEQFNFKRNLIKKGQIEINNNEERVLTLQRRSETIVKVPVEHEENQEGLIEKYILDSGVVTSSLTTVRNGYTLTSILNTNDYDVIPKPKLKLARFETMLSEGDTAEQPRKY